MKSYSTADVARLIALTPPQVRAYARAGFLRPARGPRNTYRFSFQDLVLLRAAKALRDGHVPGRRIRRALRGLAQTLPAGRALSEMRITADGNRVVVRDNGWIWQPDSGQMLFDLKVGKLARKAAPIARRHACEVGSGQGMATSTLPGGSGASSPSVTGAAAGRSCPRSSSSGRTDTSKIARVLEAGPSERDARCHQRTT